MVRARPPRLWRFPSLRKASLHGIRVDVWTMTAGCAPPPRAWLDDLDGLVVAGMGTGSLSAKVAAALGEWLDSPSRVREDPPAAALVSRCAHGSGFDDAMYKGSLAKYERLGFTLRDGFFGMNAVKARVWLTLCIAARRATSRKHSRL